MQGKEQKMVPDIRFKGYTDDWVLRKLGDISEIVRGASPRPIKDPKWFSSSSDVGWLRIKDVTEQKGRIHFLEQKISIDGQNKTRVLTTPHLLISIAATVGKPLINYTKTGVHDGFLIFEEPNFELEFMFQWLDSKRKIWNKYGQPGSQVNLNSEIVRNQKIYIPDINEQNKIGIFFNKFDELIALQQRKIDTLKLLKKALQQHIFPEKGKDIPRIRFTGFNDKWVNKQLGNIGYTFNGLSGKTKVDFGHGDANYVTYLNVFKNPLSNINELDKIEIDSKQEEVRKGDVFFTTSSETPYEVGMSSVWTFNKTNVYLNSFCFGYRTNIYLNSYYLSFLLRGPVFRTEMIKLAQGISRYNISKKQVLKLNIPVPEKDEQGLVGNYLKKIEDILYLNKIDVLKSLKQSLLLKMYI